MISLKRRTGEACAGDRRSGWRRVAAASGRPTIERCQRARRRADLHPRSCSPFCGHGKIGLGGSGGTAKPGPRPGWPRQVKPFGVRPRLSLDGAKCGQGVPVLPFGSSEAPVSTVPSPSRTAATRRVPVGRRASGEAARPAAPAWRRAWRPCRTSLAPRRALQLARAPNRGAPSG